MNAFEMKKKKRQQNILDMVVLSLEKKATQIKIEHLKMGLIFINA